ncbi:MAG: alpha/beta hydrolase [Rubrivivax sp.]
MNAHTESRLLPGPAGELECALDGARDAPGLALLCHPHPLHGGTMQHKVVQTLARAFVQLGWRAVRFNYRGVGRSAGAWDEGRGEVDDAMSVLQALRAPGQPLALAGFSFGSYVASEVAARAQPREATQALVLVGPAVETFTLAPVPADTLVIHGELDEVVSLRGVLDWARPQGVPVTVVPGAGHFFHGQMGLLKSLVLRACRPPAAATATPLP